MNKKETAQILAILREYYPRDFVSTDLQTKVEAWYLILKDYDYTLTQNAVLAFVTSDTEGFMPTLGQIIAKIKSLSNPKGDMTEVEAWALVYKAICNSAYNSVEEFEKLPDVVKRAVGNADVLKSWSMLNTDEVNTVIQSNFMRSYKSSNFQQKEIDVLPSSTKQYVNQLADKMNVGLLTDQNACRESTRLIGGVKIKIGKITRVGI